MKKKSQILIVVVSSLILFLASCAKDDESAGGNDRDKFLGTWNTTSTGSQGTLNFSMNITAGASSPTQIKMENFDQEGAGTFIFGDAGGTAVSIAQQIIGSDTISGSGTYNSNNTLTFHYTVRDGQSTDSRTANAHK